MREALSLDSRALHGVVFDRSARPRNEWKRLDCQDPGVNLRPILTANESSSELEIVKPRLYSGDAAHQVVGREITLWRFEGPDAGTRPPGVSFPSPR
jgi:hypothetical protein